MDRVLMRTSPAKAAPKTNASPPKKSAPRRTPSTPAAIEAERAVEKAEADLCCSVERQRIIPETRAEMLERLTNPIISLHETSVILRVCGATVRHYCDVGYLPHCRTPGGQRRFYLREVLAFLRQREAEKRKKNLSVNSSRYSSE